jgi:hypothetical protein
LVRTVQDDCHDVAVVRARDEEVVIHGIIVAGDFVARAAYTGKDVGGPF